MEEILKLFISQPMHGLDDDLILKQRSALKTVVEAYMNSISELMCDFKIDLIDQFSIPDPDDFNTTHPTETSQRIYRLGRSIQLLANTDVCVFYGNWKKSKGCTVELGVVMEYGINIITQSELISFCKSNPKYNNEFELLWAKQFDEPHDVVNPFIEGDENENNKAR